MYNIVQNIVRVTALAVKRLYWVKLVGHQGTVSNEKVSTGYTEISLHIRSPKNWGRGYSGFVKSQSTKSCPNFNFQGGGGIFWTKSHFL